MVVDVKMIKMWGPLGVLYFTRNLDTDDDDVIFYSQLYFGVSMSVLIFFWLYILSVVTAKNELTTIQVTDKDLQPANPVGDALASKIEPKQDAPELKEMTVSE